MNGLRVFYGICGTIIVAMLIRIWFKNRAAKASVRSASLAALNKVTPKPTAPAPLAPAPASSVVATTPVPQPVPVVEPSKPVWSEPQSVVAATSSSFLEPPPYIPSASSSILRSHQFSTWEDRRLLESTGVLKGDRSSAMPRVLAADVPGMADTDRTFGSALNPAMAALLPESNERREAARKELLAAGYYSPHAVENLAAVRYALMMLGIVVFGGLLLIAPARLEPWAIAGLVIGPALGWALPMLYIRKKAGERLREISKAMPDLLDMLNMCVSQGLTVPDALKRILRDFRGIYPALSQELSIVTEQAQINDLRTALDSFGERIDLPEVHSFTSLLIQTERMGTSISEALTTYSDTMRESLKQLADEKGNRATFRLLFPTVLCLMPAVYLFLLGPAVNELSKFFNAGGRDSLDSGSAAIQRLYNQRGVNNRRR